IRLWKVQVLPRHQQFGPNAVETKLTISAFEGERMIHRHLCAVEEPFVHSPEMRRLEREVQFIDDSRDQRKLFSRANRPTNADWIIRSRLAPGIDVLECLGQINILQSVVEHYFEAGPREFRQ